MKSETPVASRSIEAIDKVEGEIREKKKLQPDKEPEDLISLMRGAQ